MLLAPIDAGEEPLVLISNQACSLPRYGSAGGPLPQVAHRGAPGTTPALLPKDLVIDGELIAWDPSAGRLDFAALQARMTAGRRIRTVALEVDIEVTRYERPKVLGTPSMMAGSMVIGELPLDLWPLVPDSAGTATSPWPAKVLGPLVAMVGRRQERAIWPGLKDWLENGGTTPRRP